MCLDIGYGRDGGIILFQLVSSFHQRPSLYLLSGSYYEGESNENLKSIYLNMGTGFFVHRRIVSAVKRVKFVSVRLSYIVLRGRWRNIIVVNVHAPSEGKCDESKDSFHEESEQVFDHFPKYNMKMLLGDFNAKVG